MFIYIIECKNRIDYVKSQAMRTVFFPWIAVINRFFGIRFGILTILYYYIDEFISV